MTRWHIRALVSVGCLALTSGLVRLKADPTTVEGAADATRAAQTGPRFVRSQLTWFDRVGKKVGVVGGLADYGNLELSPAGDRVAVAVLDDSGTGRRDLWIVDVATGRHTPFATTPADENWMIWSHDATRVVFNSGRNGGLDLYQSPSTATSALAGDALLVDRDAKWPVSWSADGRHVLYVVNGQRTGNDILVLPLSGDKTPYPFKQTAQSENWAAFSPDGRWVAYSSDESGTAEVYVSAFPPPASGRKSLVSTSGGTQTRWRRDGKELYFLSSDRQIVAASVNGGGTDFEVLDVRPLFQIRLPWGQYHAFDATADGQRFLVNAQVTQTGPSTVAH